MEVILCVALVVASLAVTLQRYVILKINERDSDPSTFEGIWCTECQANRPAEHTRNGICKACIKRRGEVWRMCRQNYFERRKK